MDMLVALALIFGVSWVLVEVTRAVKEVRLARAHAGQPVFTWPAMEPSQHD